MTGNLIVGLQNAAWAALAWPVGIAFLLAYLKMRKDRERHYFALPLCAGISLVAITTAIHRTYWWLWRMALSRGDIDMAAWYVDNADFVLLVVIAGACAGYVFHAYARLRDHFPRAWGWIIAAYMTVPMIITWLTFGPK